jgi:hypothetical protein
MKCDILTCLHDRSKVYSCKVIVAFYMLLRLSRLNEVIVVGNLTYYFTQQPTYHDLQQNSIKILRALIVIPFTRLIKGAVRQVVTLLHLATLNPPQVLVIMLHPSGHFQTQAILAKSLALSCSPSFRLHWTCFDKHWLLSDCRIGLYAVALILVFRWSQDWMLRFQLSGTIIV